MNGKIDYRCGNHRVASFGQKKIFNFAYNFEFDIFALEPRVFGFASALNWICQVFCIRPSKLMRLEGNLCAMFREKRCSSVFQACSTHKTNFFQGAFFRLSPQRSRSIGGDFTQKNNPSQLCLWFFNNENLMFLAARHTLLPSRRCLLPKAENFPPPVRRRGKKI